MEDDLKGQLNQVETATRRFPWFLSIIATAIVLVAIAAGALFVVLKRTSDTSHPAKSFGVLPLSQDAPPGTVIFSGATKEIVTHKIFRGTAVAATITEHIAKYHDGSLETIVRNGVAQDAPILSHTIFLRDATLQLRNGTLTEEHLRTPRNQAPATLRETLSAYLKQSPGLSKQTVTRTGRQLDKYVIGKPPSTSFNIVAQAFAAEDSTTLNVYTDPESGQIVAAESIENATGSTQEQVDFADPSAIDYPPLIESASPSIEATSTPIVAESSVSLSPSPEVIAPFTTPESSPSDVSLAPSPLTSTHLPVPAANESGPDVAALQNEARETKIITNDPAINPTDAVLFEPLSIIATTSGYSSPLLQYRSKLFVLPSIVRDIEREKGTSVGDISKFTKYVKIRIDGSEIPQVGATPAASVEVSDDWTYEHIPTETPWILDVRPPAGLAPGYHTVDVYLADQQQWFSLPQLLVVALPSNESAVEITGFISAEQQRQFAEALAASPGQGVPTPPDYVVLPGEKVRVNVWGKNFQPPLALYLDSTRLDESMVQVVDSSHIILTIPLSFSPPKNRFAYTLTLEQGTQRVVRQQSLQNFCGINFQPHDHYNPSTCPPSATP